MLLLEGFRRRFRGGKFGHGFFSAGVTKGAGGAFLPGGGDVSASEAVGGTLISAVIGGTASAISGGKFANGAVTGAMQHIFNALRGKPGKGQGRRSVTQKQKEFMKGKTGIGSLGWHGASKVIFGYMGAILGGGGPVSWISVNQLIEGASMSYEPEGVNLLEMAMIDGLEIPKEHALIISGATEIYAGGYGFYKSLEAGGLTLCIVVVMLAI